MSHAFLFIPSTTDSPDSLAFRKGVRALSDFKSVQVTDQAESDLASIAVAPAANATDKRIARSADGQVWIVDLGTWLPLPAITTGGVAWLVDQYLSLGAQKLARSLQGFFALLIIDQRSQQVHVISDRCGSLHLYWRDVAEGNAVCTSSAVLALCGEARLDPVAVHEFVSTGILYEDRSLWQDIRKVSPATVLTINAAGVKESRYWTFADVTAESFNLDQAVERTHHGLVEVLKALPRGDRPLVSDLTGGYDSRFLLAGLLEANRPFTTTVSGTPHHPDVQVARRIADAFNLKHQHIESNLVPTPEEFDTALSMTDGEYDAFDFARILKIHRRLSAVHSMSLNGSFGELARGYWWELLWPRLGQRRPLDVAGVARKRFAAIGYNKVIFAPAAQLDLAVHMAAVAGRAIQPVSGFPNTTQMDCVYYGLRMQRWQGRIASSTNQLWPAFSPIGFAQVLDSILAAKAGARFRSLLVRALFSRFAPGLALIPLEHGYPPMPATSLNLWRFGPVLNHYGGKVWGKVSTKLGIVRSPAGSSPDQEASHQAEISMFMHTTGMGDWSKSPRLSHTGHFHPEPLQRLLETGSLRMEQWRRLMTLEALLRKME